MMGDSKFSKAFEEGQESSSSKDYRISPMNQLGVGSPSYLLLSRSLKEEMYDITDYITEFKHTCILTSWKGTSLILSKDQKIFYIANQEGLILAVSAENNESLVQKDLNSGKIWTLALTKDERFAFAAGQNCKINRYMFANEKLIDCLQGHTDEVNVLKISSDDKILYSAGDDSRVMMWDITILAAKPVHLYSHKNIVYNMDLSYDDKYLATCSGDNSVIVFDVDHREILKVLTDSLFPTIWCVKITRMNIYIAFGDQKPRYIFTNLRPGRDLRYSQDIQPEYDV